MKHMKQRIRAALLGAALALGGTAEAGLIGMDVQVYAGVVDGGVPLILDTATVTVGPGVELSGFASGAVNVDLDDDTITMVSLVSGLVPALDFVGLAFDWDTTWVVLDGLDSVSSDIFGFDPARVVLNPVPPLELSVNFAGLPVFAGNYVQVGLKLHTVPEPTWPALALSAAGALWWSRRRKGSG